MSGPASGWYPDPQGGSSQRWWDGQAWTGQVRLVSAEPTSAPESRPQPEAGAASPVVSEQPVAVGGGSGRRWLLMGGLLVVVMVAAAGGWWAAGGGGTSEPDGAVAADEVGQDPGDAGAGTDAGADGGDGAAAPSEQPPLSDARQWRRVAHDESVFGDDDGQVMSSVTVGGPGLVAVGHDASAAAVWTSSDGIVWQRVAHDEGVFGGDGEQEMSSVVAGGRGLVAVGWDAGREAAVVWTSTDGLVWERVAHDEAVFGGDRLQKMSSVVAGGPGLVAVGWDAGREAAAVWTSTDGLVWERVAHDEAVFGGGFRQSMRSVAVGGPGLVAVGHDGGRDAAAVWTSTDGIAWQRVPHDEAALGGDSPLTTMYSITVGGPGLVAVGRDIWQGAVVWTSTDGLVWERVAQDEAAFGGDGEQVMWSVTAGGPGLVAVGADSGRESAAVWTSADGSSWQRITHDETVFGGDDKQSMRSVAAGGPGLVAVGSGGGAGAVWTCP